MEDVTLWSVVSGALGFGIKALWDSYAGYQDKVRLETWKLRIDELERRLSQFYWPLYIRLQRDDVIWRKVFFDLSPWSKREKPAWVAELSEDDQKKLAKEIEDKVLLPNHAETVTIIRSAIHLANADPVFEDMLVRYIRHADAYSSLRSAGSDLSPKAIGEKFPDGLTEAVRDRLTKYQKQYEELLRDRGLLDLSHVHHPHLATKPTSNNDPGDA